MTNLRCPGPQPVIPQTPVNKLNQSLKGVVYSTSDYPVVKVWNFKLYFI